MFIIKTIIIFCTVFLASYAWFNFETLFTDQKLKADIMEESSSVTFFFPISYNKVTRASVEKAPLPIAGAKPVNKVKADFNLTIPSLGISAPIVFESTTNEAKIYKQLEKGVVHYAGTPIPGQPGTAIILGHSSVYPWYKGKYGHIFSSLSKLKNGDIIQIKKDGTLLSYKVSHSIIFSPNATDDYELRGMEITNGSSIVLMTCWPNGTNAKRIAVRADLI